MPVEVRRTAEALELDLTGEWSAQHLTAIFAELGGLELGGTRRVVIDASGLERLDLSAAWALHRFLERAHAAGVEVSFRGTPPDQLRLIDETMKEEPGGARAAGVPQAGRPPVPAVAAQTPGSDARAAQAREVAAEVEAQAQARSLTVVVGRYTVRAGGDFVQWLAFFGRACVTFVGSLGSARRLRPISVTRHVYDTGITATPIVSLIAFLISVILAYLSAEQLRGYGVDIYVVDLVTIGVLRELGVLLTAIIVAGRSGSSFAAELGSMKLNEEVDALIATGVDPFEVLVVPRVIGLIIAMPLLTVVADLIGLTGGALLCRFLLDMPLTQYVNRVNEAIAPTTFWVGIIKAPVFALLIALAGCYHGMQVRGSARELGRLVTVAVVQAIFLVILADAVFAILFLKMNI
jgi:phospholipid/cholesterol/gamma-HCH transport system permease protein